MEAMLKAKENNLDDLHIDSDDNWKRRPDLIMRIALTVTFKLKPVHHEKRMNVSISQWHKNAEIQ